MKESLDNFYLNWRGNLENYLKGYIYNEAGELNPRRLVFAELKEIVLQFLAGEAEEKVVLLPGIRGVGKTTLLAQMYFMDKYAESAAESERLKTLKNIIYITADNLQLNDYSLKEFFAFYEKQLGGTFEDLKDKTLLLIDEIHYDKKWALFLKSLYDRSQGHRHILILATGSSALLLQANPDLARRSAIKKIYPLDFAEYIMLAQAQPPVKNLKERLLESIFKSSSAAKVFEGLKACEKEVVEYWSKIGQEQEILIWKYFETDSFPFNLHSKNKTIAFDKIKSVIDKIIEKDLLESKIFDTNTLAKLPNIFYLLGNSDEVNVSNLSGALPMHVDTLRKVLAALVKAEVLMKIPSYGRAYTQARKPLKYLFLSPSIRASILNGMAGHSLKGKLLEDYCALIFSRNLNAFSLYYDSSKGGADFILKDPDGEKIVIEVGFNKEEANQIFATSKMVAPRYSLLVGGQNLSLLNNSIVKIPLAYWLLI